MTTTVGEDGPLLCFPRTPPAPPATATFPSVGLQVLWDLQPLVPEVLATIALGFLVAALVTLTLTTAEGYPTTSRALGLCLGGLAVISGATGLHACVRTWVYCIICVPS